MVLKDGWKCANETDESVSEVEAFRWAHTSFERQESAIVGEARGQRYGYEI